MSESIDIDVQDETVININEETIDMMYRIKLELESRSKIDTNKDIRAIIKNIENYLLMHCVHCIVHDYIDISHERSTLISYCEKCYTTVP